MGKFGKRFFGGWGTQGMRESQGMREIPWRQEEPPLWKKHTRSQIPWKSPSSLWSSCFFPIIDTPVHSTEDSQGSIAPAGGAPSTVGPLCLDQQATGYRCREDGEDGHCPLAGEGRAASLPTATLQTQTGNSEHPQAPNRGRLPHLLAPVAYELCSGRTRMLGIIMAASVTQSRSKAPNPAGYASVSSHTM